MPVDIAWSEPHYRNHMQPIFDALPPETRGQIIRLKFGQDAPRMPGRTVMVASYQDVRAFRRSGAKLIHVEHGAGQSYRGDEKSAWWPGYATPESAHHYRNVKGFICPNKTVAAAWAPKPVAVVGCPKLDRWLTSPRPTGRTICFAWHWDCKVAPETRTAWPHYAESFPALVNHLKADGWTVYAHQHPKWRNGIRRQLETSGATILDTEVDVFTHARVLAVDNSSLGVEFLAVGRPTIWLNAPWYRRGIDHGGRFWDWTVDVPTVDGPDELFALNPDVFDHDPISGTAACARDNYAFLDGLSSRRAADWVTALLTDD